MNREELLRNGGYWTSKIQIDLFNQLESYLKENNMNQSQLAKKLGVTKGYISQVLNGDFDHRISKFVELALAINKIPEVSFIDLNKAVKIDTEGYTITCWQVTKKQPYYEKSDLNEGSDRIEKIVLLDQKTDVEPSASAII